MKAGTLLAQLRITRLKLVIRASIPFCAKIVKFFLPKQKNACTYRGDCYSSSFRIQQLSRRRYLAQYAHHFEFSSSMLGDRASFKRSKVLGGIHEVVSFALIYFNTESSKYCRSIEIHSCFEASWKSKRIVLFTPDT